MFGNFFVKLAFACDITRPNKKDETVTTDYLNPNGRTGNLLEENCLIAGKYSCIKYKILGIKRHVKHALSLQKLLRYDSNENFSNNIMMQLDCDVEFTSVKACTVW